MNLASYITPHIPNVSPRNIAPQRTADGRQEDDLDVTDILVRILCRTAHIPYRNNPATL